MAISIFFDEPSDHPVDKVTYRSSMPDIKNVKTMRMSSSSLLARPDHVITVTVEVVGIEVVVVDL